MAMYATSLTLFDFSANYLFSNSAKQIHSKQLEAGNSENALDLSSTSIPSMKLKNETKIQSQFESFLETTTMAEALRALLSCQLADVETAEVVLAPSAGKSIDSSIVLSDLTRPTRRSRSPRRADQARDHYSDRDCRITRHFNLPKFRIRSA